jgi:GNAT superfamily N-acetyltransferase
MERVMESLLIRTAALADLDAALDLLANQFAEHGISLPADRLEAGLAGLIADPNRGFVLLARDGSGSDAGAASSVACAGSAIGLSCTSFTWSLEHGGQSAWLEELYVVPERRGAGVGTRLLSAAREKARAAGARAIDLEVEESHARAERLYVREGFRRHTRVRWVFPLY